jgi:dolichol-phosphate mannosyltransferase
MNLEIPKYDSHVFFEKRHEYCVGIPVLNEGEKIQKQLQKMKALGIDQVADIFIFDGNSKDGALSHDFLQSVGVRALCIKKDLGKQGAHFRMGFHHILQEGYLGIVTIDGNGKDSVEDIPKFIAQLKNGFDFIQGSRYIAGGHAVNTPLLRHIAVRMIHAPWISLLAGIHYTDTTSAFRGISAQVLRDERLALFRNIFSGYELLFYMSARIPRLGYRTLEIPVTRAYPKTGKTPTKISFLGNFNIILELLYLSLRKYHPK